jgi:hypothetical protein
MKYYAILMTAVMVAGIFFAGCAQSGGNAPVTPGVPATPLPASVAATLVPATVATGSPQQIVTITHQISQQKELKDSELLFTLQVPVEWDVTTYRVNNPDDSEGLQYRTDLIRDDIFYIYTYTASRSQDQAYRDQFRKWSPAPIETTISINGITYDRFESTSSGKTHVAYVARKGSANERGYASVLVFTANDSNRFEKDDYEQVVSSFRYLSAATVTEMPATEIERSNPPFETSGSATSGKSGSSDSAVSGGCSRCGVS